MNFAVEAQARELDTLLEEFRDTLRQVNNFNSGDRQLKLQLCAQLEQQIKTARAGYILELKTLEDEEMQTKCRQWLRERNATFQNLVSELEIRKNEIDRSLLQAEAAETEDVNVEGLTIQQAVVKGDKIQDRTQEAVDRIQKLVADAEDVGLATAQKMDEQLVQMGYVGEGITDVEYNAKRARHTAKVMARNAASDRCIQVLSVAILICVVIAIILIATKKS